jgi:hypothetical protein
VTSSGLETVTFRLVAKLLNNLRYRIHRTVCSETGPIIGVSLCLLRGNSFDDWTQLSRFHLKMEMESVCETFRFKQEIGHWIMPRIVAVIRSFNDLYCDFVQTSYKFWYWRIRKEKGHMMCSAELCCGYVLGWSAVRESCACPKHDTAFYTWRQLPYK